MSDYGVVTSPASLCFTRILPASVERVWAFLTESDKRGLWLASGDMELREGGGVTLRFVHADLSSVAEPTQKKRSATQQTYPSTGTDDQEIVPWRRD
ncbi:hypothetical protein ACV36C_38820, partial [Pseudomonas aeruginosa]